MRWGLLSVYAGLLLDFADLANKCAARMFADVMRLLEDGVTARIHAEIVAETDTKSKR